MLRVSATSLMPTRRFSSTIFFTFSMLSSLTEMDGRLARGKFSTTSRPSLKLNALCHTNTCVLDRVDSPKHLCNIFNDSVAVIPLERQNFKQTRGSIFFSIVKIARQTFRVVSHPIENSCIGSFRGSLLGVPCMFLYRIMYENHQGPVQDPVQDP